MPFSPVEKNWRSQREMVVLENGIEYFQVNEYKNRELLRIINNPKWRKKHFVYPNT